MKKRNFEFNWLVFLVGFLGINVLLTSTSRELLVNGVGLLIAFLLITLVQRVDWKWKLRDTKWVRKLKTKKEIERKSVMRGHFWKDKRKVGHTHKNCIFDGVLVPRNQCVLEDGSLHFYDLMHNGEKDVYDNKHDIEHFEYLGKGIIYSIHGNIQSPFRRLFSDKW
ncbi:MAG: hypothetical protein ACTSQA_06040 [Candidatus Heimdallarchaeaceae archaeon]